MNRYDQLREIKYLVSKARSENIAQTLARLASKINYEILEESHGPGKDQLVAKAAKLCSKIYRDVQRKTKD